MNIVRIEYHLTENGKVVAWLKGFNDAGAYRVGHVGPMSRASARGHVTALMSSMEANQDDFSKIPHSLQFPEDEDTTPHIKAE